MYYLLLVDCCYFTKLFKLTPPGAGNVCLKLSRNVVMIYSSLPSSSETIRDMAFLSSASGRYDQQYYSNQWHAVLFIPFLMAQGRSMPEQVTEIEAINETWFISSLHTLYTATVYLNRDCSLILCGNSLYLEPDWEVE